MNPLIDLLTILIGKLGTTTEMFLVWLQLHNSESRGLTFVATFSSVENLVSMHTWVPKLEHHIYLELILHSCFVDKYIWRIGQT